MIYALDAVNRSVDVQVVDDTGLPVTGLVAATFPAVTYSLAGASVDVSISLVDLAAITTAWTSGGLKERGGGVYRLDLPNAVFGTAGEIKIRGETAGKHLLAPWIEVGVTVGAVSGDVSANVVEWAGVAAAVGVDNLPKVGLWGVFGSTLTQAAGNLAASLSKFLDVAAPTFTAAAVDQTGDSYARIGATGSGLTSLALHSDATAIETAVAALGSPQQAGQAATLPAIPAGWITAAGIAAGALDGKGDWLLAGNYTTSVTVAAYAAGQDPWSLVKAAVPSATPGAGTVEALLQLIAADQYTDETTDPMQWHAVYVVAGSGAPGTGHVLATKKLFDTAGAKVTANTQVIGQASQ